MKKILKICLFAVIIFTTILFSGCNLKGCNFKYNQKQTRFYYGDFVYTYANGTGASRTSNKGKNVIILELSNEGEQKDTIIIPEEIDGKPVIQLGMAGFMWCTKIGIEHYDGYGKMLALYFPKTILALGGTINAKIFLIFLMIF